MALGNTAGAQIMYYQQTTNSHTQLKIQMNAKKSEYFDVQNCESFVSDVIYSHINCISVSHRLPSHRITVYRHSFFLWLRPATDMLRLIDSIDVFVYLIV